MKRIAVFALATLLTPLVASAQSTMWETTWDQKGYVNVYLGGQAGTDSVDGGSTFRIYDEIASVDFRQEHGGGFAFLVGGGARVWRNLVIGGSLTRVSSDQTVEASAQIPHPLVYNQPRTAAVAAEGYKHAETAFHVHAKWMIPVGDRFDVGVFGGPSFVGINHDFAAGPVTVTEAGFPYSSVTVSAPRLISKSKSAVGVNIGADATYRVTTQVGVGGFFMYTAASADIEVEDATREVSGGGLMFGAGARVSF